jgi:hypothetical protein
MPSYMVIAIPNTPKNTGKRTSKTQMVTVN